MTMRPFAGPAFLATLLWVGAAHAQTTPPISDVGPPPAEERGSAGAIVLENSLVPAQKKALAESGARTGVVSVGRGAVRSRSQARSEAATARAAEITELRQRGAGSLTEK